MHTLGTYFGHNFELGWLGVPFTVIAVAGLVNAFNMMDGLDGVCGCLGVLPIALLMLHGTHSLGTLLLAGMLGAGLIPYLAFNLGLFGTRRKIFMGDAGSMALGFIVAWSLIHASQGGDATTAPAIVLWFVAIPAMDALTVMLSRAVAGHSPLLPGREHIHHVLRDAGLGRRQTLLVLVGAAVFFALVGELLGRVSPMADLVVFLAMFASYASVRIAIFKPLYVHVAGSIVIAHSGVCLIVMLTFAVAAHIMGAYDTLNGLILLAAATVGFLIFNFNFRWRKSVPALGFPGAGSMFLGFTLALTAIYLSQRPVEHIPAISAVWVMGILVLDTVSIMLRRLAHGKNPFSADRSHLHQLLMALGLEERRAVLLIWCVQIVFSAVGITAWLYHLPDSLMLYALLATFVVYHGAMVFGWWAFGVDLACFRGRLSDLIHNPQRRAEQRIRTHPRAGLRATLRAADMVERDVELIDLSADGIGFLLSRESEFSLSTKKLTCLLHLPGESLGTEIELRFARSLGHCSRLGARFKDPAPNMRQAVRNYIAVLQGNFAGELLPLRTS